MKYINADGDEVCELFLESNNEHTAHMSLIESYGWPKPGDTIDVVFIEICFWFVKRVRPL